MLESIKEKCTSCTQCGLYKTKTNTVFGVGNENADIMFVGEDPGESEDLSGVPFVGRAGQLLDKYLFEVDIDRDDVYIANILKCRPQNNRDPLPEEQDACIAHLREQVRLIKPKIIVCLGRISAMKLIDPNFRITREHGTFFKKGAFEIVSVYHPSLLLRDPSKREETFIDMKKIAKKLEGIEK